MVCSGFAEGGLFDCSVQIKKVIHWTKQWWLNLHLTLVGTGNVCLCPSKCVAWTELHICHLTNGQWQTNLVQPRHSATIVHWLFGIRLLCCRFEQLRDQHGKLWFSSQHSTSWQTRVKIVATRPDSWVDPTTPSACLPGIRNWFCPSQLTKQRSKSVSKHSKVQGNQENSQIHLQRTDQINREISRTATTCDCHERTFCYVGISSTGPWHHGGGVHQHKRVS